MGVLNREQIKRKIREEEYPNKLLVTPLLSEDQIGPASIDIRLGSSLAVPRKTYVESQDVTDRDRVTQIERRHYDLVRLQYHQKFILHPDKLILGVTLEYLSIPPDLFATVASRSSWGRLGLVVATASVVQPGYKGCLTLELANLSDSPIALYPGLPVGQLVIHEVELRGEKVPYKGRYHCPTEAGLPGFYVKESDDELPFWGNRGRDASL